jgi:TonB family protein
MKTPAFSSARQPAAAQQEVGEAARAYGFALHNLILAELRQTELPNVTVTQTTVIVRFALDRQGQLVEIGTQQSSGSEVLDDLLRQIVRRASRHFGPFPPELPGAIRSYSVPITFR